MGGSLERRGSMNTRNGLRYAATGAVTETRYREASRAITTPNLTLPTRNTFTRQYSYASDEATDLG